MTIFDAAESAPTFLIDLKEVLPRTRVGRATIYRWMEKGQFPKPLKLSESMVRWREADLERWISEKMTSS